VDAGDPPSLTRLVPVCAADRLASCLPHEGRRHRVREVRAGPIFRCVFPFVSSSCSVLPSLNTSMRRPHGPCGGKIDMRLAYSGGGMLTCPTFAMGTRMDIDEAVRCGARGAFQWPAADRECGAQMSERTTEYKGWACQGENDPWSRNTTVLCVGGRGGRSAWDDERSSR
jgi:hypothetical protein